MTAILKGQSGLLNCTARGLPEPMITWTKDGEPLDLDDVRIQLLENGSLLLDNVRLNDTGDYKCNATNELGFDESDDAMLVVNSEYYSYQIMRVFVFNDVCCVQCIQCLCQHLKKWYTWNWGAVLHSSVMQWPFQVLTTSGF